jgi:phosphoribosylanthranilate isomerase
MTWIKICGTTNLEDALTAVDAGADALGFVFYEKSPRNVDPKVVREIVGKLPPQIEKVGVLPDTPPSSWKEFADQSGLTAIQIYYPFSGPATRDHSSGLHAVSSGSSSITKIYFAFSALELMGNPPRIKVNFQSFAPRLDAGMSPPNPSNTVVLDSGTPHQPGGTGKPFDWKGAAPLVESISKDVNVVIAGGLNANNVADAIRILRPWGVDVVSGVEASPGKKDPEKVRAFIKAVRRLEAPST